MSHIHIALADDHPLYVYAVKEKLKNIGDSTQIDCASNYQELFRIIQAAKDSLDLVILDLSMPGCKGVQGIEYIHTQFPSIPMLVVSGHDDFEVRQECLKAGAAEFISKSEPEQVLINSICSMVLGEHQAFSATAEHDPKQDLFTSLTPSQQKVLVLMSDGLSNKLIARELQISEKTVRVHASAIFKQLNVENRTQAALLFKEEH
ncbi:response regulator transcription factor [Shewanella sp. AS1]|uniref:response regulator n=1 Tax=Shewanella sp. AS1 TaxID=2907626 RepID=UPI001F44F3D5|nr:response regulator transcription factor [Shewanella sp. AS1]MCE9680272.1 response regulator transcription factor [Shewanella sp. AS1]